MRHCAALLLLVSALLPGCGLTNTVWRGGPRGEGTPHVDWVNLSPGGDVLLHYTEVAYGRRWGIGFFEPEAQASSLVIQVPSIEMERLLARGRASGAIAEVSAEEVQKFLRLNQPGSPHRGGHVRFSIESHRGAHAVVFAYPHPGRDGPVEGRRGEEATVRFHLPGGRTPKALSPALRVLLTPPAAIADAAADAVVIVTAPVWFPVLCVLISQMDIRVPTGGHL